MEILPYYSDLKLVGHLACAFVAAILSGTLLAGASMARGDARLVERSYCFALLSSAAIWVLPMFFDIEMHTREIIAYVAIGLSFFLVKFVFEVGLKASFWHLTAFAAGQGAVFIMLYKKVF